MDRCGDYLTGYRPLGQAMVPAFVADVESMDEAWELQPIKGNKGKYQV